jgi:N-acetylglucosaminyl-diphospho-decaprenol L-rhamnosyltransferase
MDLSVVIVNFNTRDALRDCLHSLLPELAGISHEVLIVDNGSTDGSVAMLATEFPSVTVLTNPQNLGFARANNRALRRASGRWLLLLNPDTLVKAGAVDTLLTALRNLPGAVAVGPRVIRPDGRLDLACRRSFPSPGVAAARLMGLSRMFPRSRIFARYNRTFDDPETPGEIDAGTAAAMLFTRDPIAAIQFFDEEFFMYGEDLDLCYRLKQRGGRIYYVPQALVVHLKGLASRQQARPMLREFHRSMWLFYRKHYLRGWRSGLAPVVWAAIRLRYGMVVGWNLLRGRQVVSP